MLTPSAHFKATFSDCGTFTIKCLINYDMKGSITVTIPMPKYKEWERPVIPATNKTVTNSVASATVSRILSKSATSLDVIKEKALLQTMSTVLMSEENLEMKSLSRKDLEATFSNYSPVLFDIISQDLCREDRQAEDLHSVPEETSDEEQERKFLEEQRTSSRSFGAKSLSFKNSPESSKSVGSEVSNPSAS